MIASVPLLLVEIRGVRLSSPHGNRRRSTFGLVKSVRYARKAVPERRRGRGGRAIACLGFPASPGLAEETMLDSLAEDLRLDYHR
jgi:hypothetical protein